MANAWRNFKTIFSRPLFTIISKPEMLIFHPYSTDHFEEGNNGRICHILCVKMILFNEKKKIRFRSFLTQGIGEGSTKLLKNHDPQSKCTVRAIFFQSVRYLFYQFSQARIVSRKGSSV